MSLRSNDPDRVSLSQSGLNSGVQSISNRASRPIQGDDLVGPSNSSFRSSLRTAHGTPQDMKDWTMNGSEPLDQAISSSKPDSPAVHMLAFSMSHQLMTPMVGPNDVMFPGMTDFPAVQQDPNDSSDMSEELKYSYMDFFDSDPDMHSGTPDDTYSDEHSSHTGDGQLTMSPEDPWNSMMDDAGQYPRENLDQLSSGIFQPVPISPPLTEASNDVSVTSSCSHLGFSSFIATDDALLGDFTSIGNQGVNPMEPLFLNTVLTEQDPNK
ncbi:uncharacterized protein PFLUO_LOCUS2196 [Penicillium psychrofluorescens]|uniref:uncharacterized protein n=1 Tax=Penicillium psychrofluorescens TaxID=3158075 RepID=UPI003CCD9F70